MNASTVRRRFARHVLCTVFLVFWALSLPTEAAGPKLSAERFTEEFAAAIKSAAPKFSVTIVKPLEVHVKGPQGEEATSFLDNAYAEYSRDPESKDRILERFARSLMETASVSERIDVQRIVPVVKDRAWAAGASRASIKGKSTAELVIDELNSDLIIVYAEDTELNIRYFSLEQLEKSGVERGALRSVATENLRRMLPEIELHGGEQLSMLTAGQDYVASLLLLDDIWSGGLLKVDGEIVLAVPSRDVLLFTGSKNAKAVRELQKLATEIAADSSYSLTNQLFVYRKGRFVRYGR